MSEVVRLTLVSHAMTDAMAAGRFPADEPLNATGLRQVEAVRDLEALDIRCLAATACHLAGPEQRARQTARLLGLHVSAEPRLADLDYGRWHGQTIEDVESDDLTVWLTDPARTPHGGESIIDLIDRVAGWLESLTDNTLTTVAVTHPAVIRAAILLALGIPLKSFWRIDIAPVSRIVMHYRGDCWTLRL